MQFSKTFLISSLLVIFAVSVVWNASAYNTWIKGDPPAESQEDAKSNKDNRVSRAFKGINKLGGKETPIVVSAEPVERGTLVQRVSSQGRVHAYTTIDLVNETAGRLVTLNVRDGDVVKKGQLIAQIDDADFRLDYEDAKAKYLAAQADFVVFDHQSGGAAKAEKAAKPAGETQADLDKKLKAGLISKDDYRRAKLTLELDALRSGSRRGDVIAAKTLDQAKIALDRAKVKWDRCKVYAPFSGTVFEVEVSEGALLSGSTKIAKLVNMRDLVVKAKVLESEIGQVFSGRDARVAFTALPGLGLLEGKVQAVSPFVNAEDKTIEAIIRFQSVDERIRPGMFAEVTIDAQMYDDRLMVPKLAILPRDDRKVVFKVSEDKRAQWVYVTTGVENSEFVEILTGKLEPGDLVLTDNHFTMGHNTLVKVSKKK